MPTAISKGLPSGTPAGLAKRRSALVGATPLLVTGTLVSLRGVTEEANVRARPSSVCIGSQRVTLALPVRTAVVALCWYRFSVSGNEGFLHLHWPVPVSLGRANTLINGERRADRGQTISSQNCTTHHIREEPT